MKPKALLFTASFLIIVIIFITQSFLKPVIIPTEIVTAPKTLQSSVQINEQRENFEVIATDLAIPWELAFLLSGDMLVTERPGNVKRIGKDGVVYPIEGVEHRGEGGLLGMALHPQFEKNHWIYFYLTTRVNGRLINQVVRYRLEADHLQDKKIVLENIPAAQFHDGGRIAFSPDGFLYVTTGDANNIHQAQDIHSLAGKILRIGDDGSIPEDNPYGNAVYSYGHRNIQGIAWDEHKNLWATEHGRSGISSGFDELNLIEKGANYGWPIIQGNEQKKGMHSPLLHSGANETWAPAGAVFFEGNLFFTGLRGEALYKAHISDRRVEKIDTYFKGKFGRLRAIQLGRDGFFYVTTSNTDGRGSAQPGDDKIIKIDPNLFSIKSHI